MNLLRIVYDMFSSCSTCCIVDVSGYEAHPSDARVQRLKRLFPGLKTIIRGIALSQEFSVQASMLSGFATCFIHTHDSMSFCYALVLAITELDCATCAYC